MNGMGQTGKSLLPWMNGMDQIRRQTEIESERAWAKLEPRARATERPRGSGRGREDNKE